MDWRTGSLLKNVIFLFTIVIFQEIFKCQLDQLEFSSTCTVSMRNCALHVYFIGCNTLN
jgi:hypothetical protein